MVGALDMGRAMRGRNRRAATPEDTVEVSRRMASQVRREQQKSLLLLRLSPSTK